MPDTTTAIELLSELALALSIFGGAFLYATIRGRQRTINAVFGLVIGILLTLQFINTGLLKTMSDANLMIALIATFIILSVAGTYVTSHLMPDEFREGKFEGLGKKFLAATSATLILLIASFHIIPLTELISAGTPIQALFAPAEWVFWWLAGSLLLLYVSA